MSWEGEGNTSPGRRGHPASVASNVVARAGARTLTWNEASKTPTLATIVRLAAALRCKVTQLVAMLLQSRDVGTDGIARLRLLPALPIAWPSGEVRGLVARGPVTVDLSWSPGAFEAVLLSPVDRTVEVTHPHGTTTLDLQTHTIRGGVSWRFSTR